MRKWECEDNDDDDDDFDAGLVVMKKFLKPAKRKTLVHMFCVFGVEIMKMLVTLMMMKKFLRPAQR